MDLGRRAYCHSWYSRKSPHSSCGGTYASDYCSVARPRLNGARYSSPCIAEGLAFSEVGIVGLVSSSAAEVVTDPSISCTEHNVERTVPIRIGIPKRIIVRVRKLVQCLGVCDRSVR